MSLKVTLPDIVDQEGLRCLKVYYPANNGYLRALLSVVSLLQHWYSWERDDEHGGTLAAEYWRAAYHETITHLKAGEGCDCEQPDGWISPEELSKILASIGGGSSDDEEEMGNFVTGAHWEGNKLVLEYGPCCAVEVGGTGAGGTNTIPTDIPDSADVDPTNPPESLACRKATAFITDFKDFIEFGYEAYGSGIGNFAWISNMQNNFKQFDLGWTEMLLPFAAVAAMKGLQLPGFPTYFPQSVWDNVLCQWKKILSDDTLKVTDDEFSGMKNVLKTSMEPLMAAYAVTSMDAMDKSGFSWIALNAPTIEHTGCACPTVTPEDEIIPINHTWSLVMDLTQGDYGTTKNPSFSQTHYVPGVGWVNDGLDGGGANLPQFGRAGAVDAAELCQLEYVKVHVKSWPVSLAIGGGQAQFLRVGNSWYQANTANRGAEYLVAMPAWGFNFATRIEWGWNEWFSGEGNSVYSAVIDKIVIAGTGGDYWSRLQPDGSWL